MTQPEFQIESRSLEDSADRAVAQEVSQDALLITVIVDLDNVTLRVEDHTSTRQTASGADVVWDFVLRREDLAVARKNVPAGWVPLVLFQPTSDGFGPFTSLTQVVELDEQGQVESMTVEGRLSRSVQMQGAIPRFPYHAMLYRGIGGELIEGRTLSLMASELAFLKLSLPSRVLPRPLAPPHRRAGKTHNLEVVIDSDADKLDVFPSSYPSAARDDRVVWDFKIRQGEFIPLILFYEFRPRFGARTPQINFGPFERLTISRRCVEGSQLNSFGGHYHYEAAILSSRHLSMRWLSSGDPVVDNEGIG